VSDSRDVLISFPGEFDELVDRLNVALRLTTPLRVGFDVALGPSCKIAEGATGAYPLVLSDTSEFTLEFTRPHKYEWLLSATFRYSHDETSDEFTLRCDAVGRGLLRKIANALRTPCILLRNMQTVLEEFP